MKKTFVVVALAALLAACGAGTENAEVSRNAAAATIQRTPTSIRVSGVNVCSTDEVGGMWCWGSAGGGSFGDGGGANRPVPAKTEMPNKVKVTAIGAGWSALHGCAVADGNVFCWGFNAAGQVGRPDSTDTSTPQAVKNLPGRTVSVAIMRTATCALIEDGTVSCWGGSTNSLLGRADASGINLAPAPVTGLANVRKIAGSAGHVCALKGDGTVACWGTNTSGQLGNGTFVNSSVPVKVTGLSIPVVDIAVTATSSCAVLADGSVKCWGGNNLYQLGYSGDGALKTAAPGTSAALRGKAVAVTAATSSVCALMDDATVSCWGTYPHLSNGQNSYNMWWSPGQVPGFTNMVAISVGGGDSASPALCGTTFEGTVKCIGSGSLYMMGNGTTDIGVSYTQAQLVNAFVEPVVNVVVATTTTAPVNTVVGRPVTTTAPAAATTTVAPSDTVATNDTSTTAPPSGTDPATSAPAAPTTTEGETLTINRTITALGPVETGSVATLLDRTMKVKSSITARTVAVYAGLPVPKSAKITLAVPSTKKVCSVSKSKVTGKTVGTCRIRVSVKPAKGRAIVRTLTVKVVQ